MRHHSLYARVLVLALTLVSSHAVRAAEDNDVVVGRLGNVTLKAADARRLVSMLGPDARKQLAESTTELEKLLRNELVRRAILAEAREKGYDRKAEVQYLMERGRDLALLSAYVQSQVRLPAGFPSEQDIKSAYESNRQTLVLPAQIRVARIFVKAPAKGDKSKFDSAEKKAADLASRLQSAPDDFANVAKEHSDDKISAGKGGELGWVPDSRLSPEVREAVASLGKGEVSAAVRTRDGWNIVRVLDKTPSRPRTLEESTSLLTSVLRQRWMQEQEKNYLAAMLQKSAAQLDQAEIARMQDRLQK